MKLKGIILTVLSGLIYGFTPILCAMTYKNGNNAFTLTFFRSFLILPLLLVLMKRNGIEIKSCKSESIKMILIGLFGSVLTTLLLYSSYTYIGVGTSTTLHFLYPLFVTLFCHFIYKDTLSKKTIIALVIAISGIALFIDLKQLSNFKGIVMALASAVTFAIYLTGIEKLGLSKVNNYKLSFYFASTVCVSLLVINLFTGDLIFTQPFSNYLLMAVISFFVQFVAVIFLKIGIDILGSSVASMFSMLEPVSSVVFGFMFLNESLDAIKIAGCVLIMAGIIILLKK